MIKDDSGERNSCTMPFFGRRGLPPQLVIVVADNLTFSELGWHGKTKKDVG